MNTMLALFFILTVSYTFFTLCGCLMYDYLVRKENGRN